MASLKLTGNEIKVNHNNKGTKSEFVTIEFTKIYTSTGDMSRFENPDGSINKDHLIEVFIEKIKNAEVLSNDSFSLD